MLSRQEPKKTRRGQDGFTLIELLVVMVIVGVIRKLAG